MQMTSRYFPAFALKSHIKGLTSKLGIVDIRPLNSLNTSDHEETCGKKYNCISRRNHGTCFFSLQLVHLRPLKPFLLANSFSWLIISDLSFISMYNAHAFILSNKSDFSFINHKADFSISLKFIAWLTLLLIACGALSPPIDLLQLHSILPPRPRHKTNSDSFTK